MATLAPSVIRAPETEIARDLFRRGLMISPLPLAFGLIGWGRNGLASTAYALALVLLNFLLAAWAMATAARISPVVLMATVVGSYVVRLALITLATLAVAGTSWWKPIPFGLVLIASHLVLLAWETKYVSASLAFPGLKPRVAAATTKPASKEYETQ